MIAFCPITLLLTLLNHADHTSISIYLDLFNDMLFGHPLPTQEPLLRGDSEPRVLCVRHLITEAAPRRLVGPRSECQGLA